MPVTASTPALCGECGAAPATLEDRSADGLLYCARCWADLRARLAGSRTLAARDVGPIGHRRRTTLRACGRHPAEALELLVGGAAGLPGLDAASVGRLDPAAPALVDGRALLLACPRCVDEDAALARRCAPLLALADAAEARARAWSGAARAHAAALAAAADAARARAVAVREARALASAELRAQFGSLRVALDAREAALAAELGQIEAARTHALAAQAHALDAAALATLAACDVAERECAVRDGYEAVARHADVAQALARLTDPAGATRLAPVASAALHVALDPADAAAVARAGRVGRGAPGRPRARALEPARGCGGGAAGGARYVRLLGAGFGSDAAALRVRFGRVELPAHALDLRSDGELRVCPPDGVAAAGEAVAVTVGGRAPAGREAAAEGEANDAAAEEEEEAAEGAALTFTYTDPPLAFALQLPAGLARSADGCRVSVAAEGAGGGWLAAVCARAHRGGVAYWEVAVVRSEVGSVMVGVTTHAPDRALGAGLSGRGLWSGDSAWVVHLASGNAYAHGRAAVAPGRPPEAAALAYAPPLASAAGARVGVLLELGGGSGSGGGGRLSFFDNGRPLGVAFDALPAGGAFWPCVELCHAGDSVGVHDGDGRPPPAAAGRGDAPLGALAAASNAAPALVKMRLPCG